VTNIILIIVLSENDIWMSGQMLQIHLTQKLHVLCTIIILNDKVRQALTAGNLTHLVTLNKDGSPQVSIVWVGLDGDEIVCAHLNLYQKLKNIRRDALE
jgi:Pyridoxamine 5'-phosphate oxidase